MKETDVTSKCFSFCFAIDSKDEYEYEADEYEADEDDEDEDDEDDEDEEDEDEDEDDGIFGLICTFNDEYADVTDGKDIKKYIKQFKDILEEMTGRKIFVFNRMDSDYKVYIEDIEEQKFL